jgi:hypothetical protein
MKMDNFIKIGIVLGLCVVMTTGFISVRAADNPAQAAARVALERVLNPWDNSPAPSLPVTNTLSEAVVEQPGLSDANVAGTVPEIAATPQTTPVATTPVAAPAAVTPAVVAPVAAGPAPVAPAAAPPAVPFLMLWGLLLSLLLISFVIMSILLLKLRQVKLLLLKDHSVAASGKIQPAAANASPSEKQRGT